MGKKAIPYASATSGVNAQKEIRKTLLRLGCTAIAFGEDLEKHESWVQFKHRGRLVHLPASASGWAQCFLNENPWTFNHRRSRTEYEQDALKQGHIAVHSVLRDWVKGQVTAIECGILSFEAVFMPWMLTADGRPVMERLAETNLLPAPEQPKVIPLPGAA